MLKIISKSGLFLVVIAVLCRLAWGTGEKLPPKPSQTDHSTLWSSTGKRILEIDPFHSNLPFDRFKRAVARHEARERRVKSFKPLISTVNNIEIYPKVSHVGSESVKISWLVTPEGSATYFDVHDDSIGLKVKYRPFGSTVEREIIFVIEKEELTGSMVENSYDAQNLVPGSGYIFCFSLISQKEILGALESSDYSHVSTTERNLGLTQVTKVDDPEEQSKEETEKEEEEQIVITTTENNDISIPETDILPPHLSTNPTESPSTTTTDTPVFINHPGAFAQRPRPSSRGSYAYTSTGDLVYVPGNAWSPRNKRSLAINDRNTGTNEFCTEIFTQERQEMVAWNPFVVLVAVLIVFGVLISLAIIYCLRLCLATGFMLPKCLKNKLKRSIPKATPCKEEDSDDIETCNDENKSNESISKFQCHCRNSSLPSYQEILSRHEKRENMKGTIQVRKNKSFDNLKFHPGYDVPPMSTNAVYGYDIPKFSNRGSRNLSTPSSYSWDFNDSEPETSWTGRNLDNIDSPQVKHSEGYKSINSEKLFNNSQNTSAPPLLPRARHKSITELNMEPTSLEITEDIPLYRYTSRGSSSSQVQSTPDEIPKKPPRGDEVTVSGGTLIEVPQGYIVPGQSKNLRLIVNTTPVFL